MLKAENIYIGYEADKPVFTIPDFSALPGDMVALLGVNGIGKSTLLRTIAGLQKKLSGNLLLDDRDIQSLTPVERAKLISVVLTERIFIDNITVRDFIALGRSPYTDWLGRLSDEDEKEIEKVISVMKIEKLQNRMFNQLSDGEKQKALIARALCQQTSVIILDEPTAFLDFRNKREILNLLRTISNELKKIILFSTHDIEAALQHCNKFWVMTEEKDFCEIDSGPGSEAEVKSKLKI
ncbi:MAG: ATP-binding component [Bacteroidota bacterium]|nr:ATP-binding component [Bacteroidota bacterium]